MRIKCRPSEPHTFVSRFQTRGRPAPRISPHALRYDVCGSWYVMQTAVSHTGRYEWGFFQVEVTPSLQYGRPVRS